jgi:hypothetical protein
LPITENYLANPIEPDRHLCYFLTEQ